MGGTAMIIILQQFKGLLGMKHFTTKTDIISVLHSTYHYRHEVQCELPVQFHHVI
jgi:sulfate transporter 3